MSKRNPSAILQEGLRLQKAGKLAEATQRYRQVLTIDPKQPDALHFLGVIAHHVGELDEAVELIAESLRVNPNCTAAINNLAGVLKDQGRHDEALEFYDAALAAAPEQAHLHNNRANVLKEQGRLDDAALAYREAIRLNPESFAAQSNLGAVLKEKGRLAEALECFAAALAINPESPECLSNLGITYNAMGRSQEAEELLRRAIALNPRSDGALTNLGVALREQGRTVESIAAHLQALELNPRSHFALINLGMTLKDIGRFADAAGCFEKAILLRPDSHLAYNNLGSALCELGRAEDAIVHFRKALELNPGYHPALSNVLFASNYVRTMDRAALYAEHCRFDTMFAEPLRTKIVPHTNERDPERRLRVGYVSGDLRDHPVAYLLAPVIERRDRSAQEVFCYSNHKSPDAMTERLRGLVDAWRDVGGDSDDELAARIRADGIDILVDLSGHTARNRLLVFARKPAPVQVTMIGYMQTTGLATMDYRITDERIDPIGVSDTYNTETLIRLPAGAATFHPPACCPPVNPLPAQSNGYVTFAAFNNLAKVTPVVLETWARVLHAVPRSRLVAIGRAGNTIEAALVELGVERDRIRMIERQPMETFVALHHHVDILLDTFPYNGGTTSIIAAWMGVPIITLAGDDAAARTGASLLAPLGLEELIAIDPEGYIRRAVAAAGDLARLANWRGGLRERLAPLLNGGEHFTVQLEYAFRQMWRKWCASPGR